MVFLNQTDASAFQNCTLCVAANTLASFSAVAPAVSISRVRSSGSNASQYSGSVTDPFYASVGIAVEIDTGDLPGPELGRRLICIRALMDQIVQPEAFRRL